MAISITEDIRSITDLKRNTNAVLEQIHKTKRPVILTVNGKAETVIVDAKEYEKITNTFNLLKLLAPAEEDIKEGRYTEAKRFLQGVQTCQRNMKYTSPKMPKATLSTSSFISRPTTYKTNIIPYTS